LKLEWAAAHFLSEVAKAQRRNALEISDFNDPGSPLR
jgi:hypothetical protein